MTGVRYGRDRDFGGAEFEIADRRVVGIHAEGQVFTLADADLFVALGAAPAWAVAARYVQVGLTYATGLSAHRIVQVAAEDEDQQHACTPAQIPMRARSASVTARALAALALRHADTLFEDEVRLLVADPHGVVRSHMASWPSLPTEVAFEVARGSDLMMVRALVGCHEHPSVRAVASRTLFVAQGSDPHLALSPWAP